MALLGMALGGLLSVLNPFTASHNSSTTTTSHGKPENDYQILATNLKAGNLAGAKLALAALRQDSPNDTFGQVLSAALQKNSGSPIASDMTTLTQNLQSGNVKGAQQAFAQLNHDVQTLRSNHYQFNQANVGNTGISTNSNGNNISVNA